MTDHLTHWKQRDNWTWKEFVALLLLEFVFVIGFIKFVVQPVYTQWLGDELYAGTLTGLTIAIVLIVIAMCECPVMSSSLRPHGL